MTKKNTCLKRKLNNDIASILKRMPRLHFVSFGENYTDEFLKKYKYPFAKGEIFILLGEIEHMPGHCVVIRFKNGRVYTGYHIEDFRVLSEDEV